MESCGRKGTPPSQTDQLKSTLVIPGMTDATARSPSLPRNLFERAFRAIRIVRNKARKVSKVRQSVFLSELLILPRAVPL